MNEMWVPVAEGLPDEEGMYIVCFIDGFGKANVFIWSIHEGEHMSGKQTYVDGKHYWAAVSGGEPVNKFLSNRVVAWMPLPEPYEAKENIMSLKGLRRWPVGGVDRTKEIDSISIQNAVETPFWMAICETEPERQVDVRMSYSDLKVICDLIDAARK